VVLFAGVLPASLVLWACLSIFFVSTCARLNALERRLRLRRQQRRLAGGSNAAAGPAAETDTSDDDGDDEGGGTDTDYGEGDIEAPPLPTSPPLPHPLLHRGDPAPPPSVWRGGWQQQAALTPLTPTTTTTTTPNPLSTLVGSRPGLSPSPLSPTQAAAASTAAAAAASAQPPSAAAPAAPAAALTPAAAAAAAAAELLRAHLALAARDLTPQDYEALLLLDQQHPSQQQHPSLRPNTLGAERLLLLEAAAAGAAPSLPRPVSETDLARLPTHIYEGRAEEEQEEDEEGGEAKEKNKNECAVCLSRLRRGDAVTTLPCLHMYHRGCIEPWLRQGAARADCPVCKTPVWQQQQQA
jgi:hypothetical protein